MGTHRYLLRGLAAINQEELLIDTFVDMISEFLFYCQCSGLSWRPLSLLLCIMAWLAAGSCRGQLSNWARSGLVGGAGQAL